MSLFRLIKCAKTGLFGKHWFDITPHFLSPNKIRPLPLGQYVLLSGLYN